MTQHILVTGGFGFIGSNYIRHLLETTDGDTLITNLDHVTYAANPENLADIDTDPRYEFVHGDIADSRAVEKAWSKEVDIVVNFAAESHVDRSIESSEAFIRTNVLGTQVLLETARSRGVKLFLQVSTDEVYGSLPLDTQDVFLEDTPIAPNSPYAASKAGADLLVQSYFETHGFPTSITRCSNNYGPYQYPEKLIPLFVTNALDGHALPLYGQGINIRDWIHVTDHCRAIQAVIEHGTPGEVFNIGSRNERNNLDVARAILAATDADESLITYVTDRPGHDLRYAIDPAKLEQHTDWKPLIDFEEGLTQTVAWYRDNRTWWERVRSGAFREYYDRRYGAIHE
jgi:dTDP-glucose 4,6-dehydratase